MSDEADAMPRRLARPHEVASCIPTAVVWELTLACNLKCKLCGSRAGKPRAHELSTDEAFALVAQLADMGVRDIGLIGGEVHLRKDWTDIVGAIVRAGMTCAIQTGGRGFSASVARKAAAAGVAGVGVSIDGLRDNHDMIRGFPGSFDQTIAALGHLRDCHLPTSVNTQLWSGSIGDLRPLLGIIADAGVVSWQLQLSVAMGGGADNNRFLLQPYEMLDVFPLLSELWDEAQARGVRLIIANNVGYFGPYEAKLRSVQATPTHWDGCSAGRNSLGIEADGTIKGCPSLATDTYAGGNVRDMPLSEIWKTTSELAYIRGRSTKDLWGFCGTCYYASACLGGCTWTAHSLFGRPGNNPYCHYRALKLKELGHIERVRLVEPASGVPFDNGRFELIVEDLEGRVVSVWNPSDETFSCDRSGINSPHDKHELLLCSNCDQFALPDAAHCPHCGKATLQTLSQHATREAEFSPALRRIREALGLEQPAIEG